MNPEPESSQLDLLEKENARLRRALEELSILNEVASAISSTSTLKEVVDLTVQKCVKHLNVEQGSVSLFGNEESSPLRTMVRKVRTDVDAIPYRLGDQLTGWMLKNQSPLVVNDLAHDGRFQFGNDAAAAIGSLMAVPLRLKGRMIGVLSVFNKQSADGFSNGDQRLLSIIAAQSAQVIENARLLEEEKALQRVQQELQTAHTIQMNLLPKAAPKVPGFEIAGRTLPARNVGGDYFDYLWSDPDRLTVCLGDVSGKGIAAALVMASVHATIRGQSLLEHSPSECLRWTNQLLRQTTDSATFVTMFYAVIDTKTRELKYSNGGHNPPFVISESGQSRSLTEGGVVLGLLPDVTYGEASHTLQAGDLVLIYSDGFSEAMNRRFEEFGEDRLLETLIANRKASAEAIIDRCFTAVKEHCGDAPQTDDMTMVAVRVNQ
jgi:sigma-B regulation protein RsbU (phosphoserine phosphatase)